jgi:hypothetical protein
LADLGALDVLTGEGVVDLGSVERRQRQHDPLLVEPVLRTCSAL